MAHIRAKIQGQGSVGSKDEVETEGRTSGQTLPRERLGRTPPKCRVGRSTFTESINVILSISLSPTLCHRAVKVVGRMVRGFSHVDDLK